MSNLGMHRKLIALTGAVESQRLITEIVPQSSIGLIFAVCPICIFQRDATGRGDQWVSMVLFR